MTTRTVNTTMELELNPDGSIKNKEMRPFGDEEDAAEHRSPTSGHPRRNALPCIIGG